VFSEGCRGVEFNWLGSVVRWQELAVNFTFLLETKLLAALSAN
jgi:hypothetical protein